LRTGGNPRNICFVLLGRDEAALAEAEKYIRELHVPDGFQTEIVRAGDEDNMARACNRAMRLADARYKVYLQAGAYPIHKRWIGDMLAVFDRNPELGLLGLIGSRDMPLSGWWRDSTAPVGKVWGRDRSGRLARIAGDENAPQPGAGIEPARAVAGFCLMTQYDVPWREDPGFRDPVFCAAAQALEFEKAGLACGVAVQEDPWCIWDVPLKRDIDRAEQRRFLEEYGSRLWPAPADRPFEQRFPLVSILIPAYNQTLYLREALESALNQTYPRFEIIIGDDSTHPEVELFVRPYLDRYGQLSYFRNVKTGPDYGFQNNVNCFRRAKGDFVNFLNHDDLFHPMKLEKMVRYFLEHPNLTLVTSTRDRIDEQGNVLPPTPAFAKWVEHDIILEGRELCRQVLTRLKNIIGEPTTVLFRRGIIEPDQWFHFAGERYRTIGDVAAWFALLQHGDAAVLAETLSFTRFHPERNTNRNDVLMRGISSWLKLIRQSYEQGILDESGFRQSVWIWLSTYQSGILQVIRHADRSHSWYGELMESYRSAVDAVTRV